MAAAEITIDIDRSDLRPLAFRFKSNVLNPEWLPVSGSTFGLIVRNVLGEVVLEKTAEIDDGRVQFDLSLADRAVIPRGRLATYEVIRSIGTTSEAWVRGNVNAIGGV